MEMEIEQIAVTALSHTHYQLLLSADPSRKLIDHYLERAFCFQLCIMGEVIGILVLLPTRPETIEIVNIAVASTYQNQGYGHQLIDFALAFAGSHRYQTIEVGTGSTSFQQLALYQKHGFRMTSIERDYFITHYEEPIVENNLILKDMVRLQQQL
jgi:ribosomal protein S18 acetylase RimI-like enzyme